MNQNEEALFICLFVFVGLLSVRIMQGWKCQYSRYREVMLKLQLAQSEAEPREANDELLIISFEPLGPTMPEANIYSEIFSHRKLQINASPTFFLCFSELSWLSFHCKQKHPNTEMTCGNMHIPLINSLLFCHMYIKCSVIFLQLVTSLTTNSLAP